MTPVLVSIVSVNVGQPTVIGQLRDNDVYSSIHKQPIDDDQVLLTYTNLAGDQQVQTKPKADGRQLHGGNEKAVYVFPAAHYEFWCKVLDVMLPIPFFGENLTIGDGLDESTVHVGDKWRWGTALLEVSVPRQPCSTLSLHLGKPEVVRLMWDNGRCGWYMRVLEPGTVPTRGTIEVVEQAKNAPTVTEAFTAKRMKNRR